MATAVDLPETAAARPATFDSAIHPVPRWARWATNVMLLVMVPSGLLRLGTVLGGPSGYAEGDLDGLFLSSWGPVYLVMLSTVTECSAALSFGVAQRWVEVIPRWIPFIGGRSLPSWFVVSAGWTGVVAGTILWIRFLLWWSMPPDDMTATGHTALGFLYLPLMAWMPLLAVVTLSYQRRHGT